ncbi:MAG TPA: hypothetical protein IGS53_09375 [Leptolyngbyaceae cyanobacterium M33_DOE_097]|uniref:Uncharacterized protein n=1 Tax=Oscillatoriales cyanobacterium SpSt-418 TaxID=2282169 RepID=A0A7C3PED8_9CYAN|nr:hypothetical protein [Leptolyngbyaceae cyanobacterium M33_DOE_097]
MSQDIPQWLAEIQTLREQLTQAQQESERAYESAASWRKLYETEAQQRRRDTILAQKTIEQLRREISQIRSPQIPSKSPISDITPIQIEVDQITSEQEIKARLVQALQECDRLSRLLQTEQEQHAQTRNSLTLALGDAIDLLSKVDSETLHPTNPPGGSTDAG